MNLENPFPGLRPFREDESERFFGQEDRIRELVNKLAHTRFVAVIGQSGCGKSSLVHAGLLAELRKSGRWRIGKLSPGEDPLSNLARAWRDALYESAPQSVRGLALTGTLSELRRDARALCRMAEQTQLGGSEGILLFVDQFEELFRFRRPEEPAENPVMIEGGAAHLQRQDHAAHFVDLLLEAVRDEDSGIHVVITMRSEFLGDCSAFYDLAEQVNRGTYLVPKMDRDSAEDAIVGPIELHLERDRDTIEPSLIQHLLNESEAKEDGLPLLQHALHQLWDRWLERNQPESAISFADLEKRDLGELLNDHLNSIYGELQPPFRQQVAERIFRMLSDRDAKGRETRRLQKWEDLLAGLPPTIAPAIQTVVSAFSDEKRGRTFLVRYGQWVDVSHEGLLRQWQLCKSWMQTEERDKKQLEDLTDAAARTGWSADMTAQVKKSRMALAGFTLDTLVKWRDEAKPDAAWARRYVPEAQFTNALAFLEWSETLQQRERHKAIRRAYKVAIAAAAAFVIIGVLASFVLRYAVEVREQRKQALDRAKEAEIERGKAQELRDKAVRAQADAERQSDVAVRASHEADSQRKEAEYQRSIGVWQGLVRESARDYADGNYERSALLAKQALLLHATTPDEPRYLIEERLFQILELPYLARVIKDDGAGTCVAFSPDGRWLASDSGDKTLRVWDLSQPGMPALTLKEERYLHCVAFSPDGTRLASGGYDGIRLWDLRQSNSPPVPLGDKTTRGGPDSQAESVVFSPDGTRLASVSGSGFVGLNHVQLWDLRRPDAAPLILSNPEGSRVSRVAFSPDGSRLAAGHSDNTVYVWDVRRPEASPLILKGHDGAVYAVAFAPDGRLASGGLDHTVRLWDVSQPNSPPLVFKVHEGTVFSLSFSRDGTQMASGSADNTIRIWNPHQSDEEPVVLKGHGDIVRSVAFSPDGTRLASSSFDNTVRLWYRQPSTSPWVDTIEGAKIHSVAISPNSAWLVSGSDSGMIRLWDLRKLDDKPRLLVDKGSGDGVLVFSPDGMRLASGGDDGAVQLRDLQQPNAPPIVLKGHELSISSIAFSPDGSRLASGSDDNTIRVWNLRQLSSPPLVLTGHDDTVESVAFSPRWHEVGFRWQ